MNVLIGCVFEILFCDSVNDLVNQWIPAGCPIIMHHIFMKEKVWNCNTNVISNNYFSYIETTHSYHCLEKFMTLPIYMYKICL